MQDQYVSIINDAAYYLHCIITSPFYIDDRQRYVPLSCMANTDIDQLNSWIKHFAAKHFICQCVLTERKSIAPQPLQPGGLIEYQWDHKPTWRPFGQASMLETMKAFFVLRRVHIILKRKGIQGIREIIQQEVVAQNDRYEPSQAQLNRLSAAVDAASVLYPRKTFCLAWAATFVLLALKKKWLCHLEIGIQTNPFYAHAWAISSGNVINDDPVIARVLSIIFKEPYN